MTYEKLNELWDLIKNHKNLFHGEYIGLSEVKFEISRNKFESKYKKSLKDMESIVLNDVDEAMTILKKMDIKFHHLSCAADTGMGDNSSLCIHYLNPKDKKFYALTLPGINYIPTENTKEKLNKIYSD